MNKKFLLSLVLQEGMVKQDESSVLPSNMYENTMAACVSDLKPRIAEDERPQGEGRNKWFPDKACLCDEECQGDSCGEGDGRAYGGLVLGGVFSNFFLVSPPETFSKIST